MFQPQAVRIGWYKDNRVYIRTAMPFGTRLNLKPFEVFEVHFPTQGDTRKELMDYLFLNLPGRIHGVLDKMKPRLDQALAALNQRTSGLKLEDPFFSEKGHLVARVSYDQ
jgi:hypothetical protein